MNLFGKIKKMPFMVQRALLSIFNVSKKLMPPPAYHPKKYWKKRHSAYGFDLRGVGNCTLSHEENEQVYLRAKETFSNLCKAENIDFESAHTLEIGCGTGIFTQVLLESGGENIRAIDIADTLFTELRTKFPDVIFQKLDITEDRLENMYNLIVMIDVTQHIVEDLAFSFAMKNVYSHLADGGIFIVTAWLTDEFTKRQFYEVQRPLSYYKKEFPDCEFSSPVAFRDKYIFSIKKNKK